MKRAMKGDFNLFGEAEKLYANIDNITDSKKDGENYYQEKLRYAKNLKKVSLLLTHAASKQFDKKLIEQQEILNNISNIMIDIYVAEASALRVQKMESLKGASYTAIYKDILDVLVYDAVEKARKSAYDAIYSMATPDAAKLIKAVNTLTIVAGVNVKDARRRIADKLIEDNSYKF
jgi:hypothetical protein